MMVFKFKKKINSYRYYKDYHTFFFIFFYEKNFINLKNYFLYLYSLIY